MTTAQTEISPQSGNDQKTCPAEEIAFGAQRCDNRWQQASTAREEIMSQNHEDTTVDLDSSSILELDRRLVVQESAESPAAADVDNCTAGRHHCDSEHREILHQPFRSGEFGD